MKITKTTSTTTLLVLLVLFTTTLFYNSNNNNFYVHGSSTTSSTSTTATSTTTSTNTITSSSDKYNNTSSPYKSSSSSTGGGEVVETTFIPKQKRLTEQSMSSNLRTMEYAVRGKVVIAADRINDVLKQQQQEEQQNEKKDNEEEDTDNGKQYPFDHIVYTNIGNPHGVGQLPLTWPRQVMALSDLPNHVGIDSKDVTKLFPQDAIDRARMIKKALGGHGTGAYTHSQGPDVFRKEICDFIEQRDDMEKGTALPDTIFMTNGASSGIEMILNALIADSSWYVFLYFVFFVLIIDYWSAHFTHVHPSFILFLVVL